MCYPTCIVWHVERRGGIGLGSVGVIPAGGTTPLPPTCAQRWSSCLGLLQWRRHAGHQHHQSMPAHVQRHRTPSSASGPCRPHTAHTSTMQQGRSLTKVDCERGRTLAQTPKWAQQAQASAWPQQNHPHPPEGQHCCTQQLRGLHAVSPPSPWHSIVPVHQRVTLVSLNTPTASAFRALGLT